MNDVVLLSAGTFLNRLTCMFQVRRKFNFQIIYEIIRFFGMEDYKDNLVIAISYNKLRKITNDWVTNVVRERVKMKGQQGG